MPIWPVFREGDELGAGTMGDIVGELERWRNVRCVPPLFVLDQYGPSPPTFGLSLPPRFHIQLTGNGSSSGHFWQEVIWSGTAWVGSGISRTTDDGDAAFEINGLYCPEGDEVYEAWRDNFNQIRFRAGNLLGVSNGSGIASGSISTPSSGNVAVWSQSSGTMSSSGLTVTAYNYFATAIGASKTAKLWPFNGKWACAPWDC